MFRRRQRRELLDLIDHAAVQENVVWNILYGRFLTGIRVSPRATDGAASPNGPAASLLPGGGTGRWEGSE